MPEHTMNNSKVFALSVALLGLAILSGCQREMEVPESNLHEVVFHAGWDPETRTELQEDGSVWWSPGDEISLFVGNGEAGGGYKLTSINTEPAATADFVGSGVVLNSEIDRYFAIYPYDNRSSVRDGIVYTSVPAIQYAKAGTFSDKQLISIAVSESDILSFINICGGIKFSVANSGITKVVFKDHVVETLYADNSPIA